MIALKSSILIAASRWSGFGGMQYTCVCNPVLLGVIRKSAVFQVVNRP